MHGKKHQEGVEPAELEVLAEQPGSKSQSKGYVLIALVYMLGIFMGALDMGIVNPARTVIQNTMGVADSLGVWLMTIYTLAYAVSIPIAGKLADKYGRKYVYLICILLFGTGSLLCGLSQYTGSFEMLILARAVQAVGAGGVVPVATAEVGTAFPEEKRGMALGMVGGIYGVASILGPAACSGILDLFGSDQWAFIFFINVPICIFILFAGFAKIPNTKLDEVKPIDIWGSLVMTLMILSLMIGLKNIDFFELSSSITSMDVWPYLVGFAVLLPLFVIIENRAADPAMNLHYFKNKDILVTLGCSIVSGIIMMAILFFPQFCENALYMESGSGGYFLIILGLFTGIGSPMSGKIIDKMGVKPVLGAGFLFAIIGSLFMAFVACPHPSIPTVCVSLALIGLAMGFVMGSPLNYMMLQKTSDEESNSALATLSLVRSIGTAIAPAIMVAFIVQAGSSMQDRLMDALPQEIDVSPLPYAQELDEQLAEMKADDDYKDMLKGVDIPKLADMSHIELNMSNADSEYDVTVSDEMLEKMQDSDITTIVGVCKEMSVEMFGQIRPQIQAEALEGVDTGLKKMGEGLDEMDDAIAELKGSMSEMKASIAENEDKLSSMKAAQAAMKKAQQAAKDQQGGSMPGMGGSAGSGAPAGGGMPSDMGGSGSAQMPAGMGSSGSGDMSAAIAGLQTGITEMKSGYAEMQDGLAELKAARAELASTVKKLKAVKAAVPGMFDEAQEKYLAAIDADAEHIEKVYQGTLNEGFKGMFILVACCAAAGLLMLLGYKDTAPAVQRRKQKKEGEKA
ncbi:MAG: MFS transporter [Coriobacteriales bacterium]